MDKNKIMEQKTRWRKRKQDMGGGRKGNKINKRKQHGGTR